MQLEGSFLEDEMNIISRTAEVSQTYLLLLLERLSMTLRQTANGKNETFADCFQLSVQ